MDSSENRAQRLDAPFIEKTYDEAIALVHQSAAYLDGEGTLLREDLGDQLRPVFTAESLRATTRLMQVVSWLMTQRAVLSGEMSPEEAREHKYRLGARGICLADPLDGTEKLPEYFQDLIESSRGLYERVARIEERLLEEAEVDNPVHKLLNRLGQP